ncbi:hypothetical protein HZH66_011743 [Vespula vulgaris]|uniref:Uncharacterized protein n=1 Tax=Vespula vulgaris TaxID=7454 RepID=A0A834JDY9_VESVU|nr:hypothetical protein HZH66_011743 [Vespula vulgaris]
MEKWKFDFDICSTSCNIVTVTIGLFLPSVTTARDPEFVSEIGNITVPAGRNVKLACSVKDLGTFKVS